MATASTTPLHTAPRLHTRARWMRWRTWAVASCLGLIAAVACLLGIAWWLIRSQPSWWHAGPPADTRSQSVGQDLENAIVNQLHASRPATAPWSVSISAADANDWLSSRLVKWLANREPGIDWHSTIQQTLVDFRDGRIYLGAALRSEPGSAAQIISASLLPSIDDAGELHLLAENLSIGRLPLPLGLLTADPGSLAMRLIPGDIKKTKAAADIAEALAGRRSLLKDPTITLADKRKVTLLAIIAREGRLELTCSTESP